MKILLSILLWVPVAAIKIILVAAGVFIVPLRIDSERGLPKLYWIGAARPYTVWEAAFRNPVGGFGRLIDHPDGDYTTYGSVEEPTATGPWFQKRFNIHGYYSSLRLVWRYSKTHYGELYIGWKLGSAPPEFDFALSPRFWATIGN